MSGTIVTSAPRRSSSSASGLASGRVMTMRRPYEGLVNHGSPPVCGPRPRKVLPRRAADRPRAARRRLERAPPHDHRPTRPGPGDAPEGSRAPSRAPRLEQRSRRRAPARNARSAVVVARAAGIVERREKRPHRVVVGSALHRERPWPGAGSIVSSSNHSVTARSSPSRRTPAAASTTASNWPSSTLRIRVSTLPRIERTSRSRAKRGELRCPAKAARADDRARRELRERATRPGHEAVANVLARRDGADHDARSILGREVLQRVDRDVDLTVEQCPLELGGEEALAADLGQRLAACLRPIPGRGDHARLALETGARRRQQLGHEVGLGARERRSPRAECHRRGKRRSRSPVRRGGDAEQVANGVRDLVRLAGSCALARSHGRVVEELLHERPREELDTLGDIAVRRLRGRAARARLPAPGSTPLACAARREAARPPAPGTGDRRPRPPPRESPRPWAPREDAPTSPRRAPPAGRRRRRGGRPRRRRLGARRRQAPRDRR